jgi:hypothetical protein
MKISEVIDLLEEFNSDVVHSDITGGVHYGCECCGGDSYDDESWNAMSDAYDAAEKKAMKFCSENNLVYDWADDDIAVDEYLTKISFDALFYLFSNSNIGAIKDDYDIEQDYWEMRDYYQEDRVKFIDFCSSIGFENDLQK